MANPARETLSLESLFGLFHRDGDPGRWLGRVDSEELLNIVILIVQRNQRELEGR